MPPKLTLTEFLALSPRQARARAAQTVAHGKHLAATHFATLTPAQQAAGVALAADAPGKLARCFAGDWDSKGHFTMLCLTPAQMAMTS